MKNIIKVLGITAIVVVIGFTMAGCGDSGDPSSPAHTHTWGEWTITTAATCMATGVKTRVCTLDATHTETETISVDPVNGHDYRYVEGSGTAPTCEVDGNGNEVCSHNSSHTRSGVVIPKLGHNYVWETTSPATCTTVGAEKGTCSNDGSHTTTHTIAINPDVHNWQAAPGSIAPTCTTAGSGTVICSYNPAHTQTAPSIPALGHDWGNWEVTTPVTCETAGEEKRGCSHDATHEETRPVTALGHDWELVETTATFIAAGVETYQCTHDPLHTDIRNVGPYPITTNDDWTAAKSQLNGKTGEYTLTVSGNVGIDGGWNNIYGQANTFGTTATGSSLIVTLKGNGKLYLTSRGNILLIDARQTLIIDSEDLTLDGLTNGKNNATQDNNSQTVAVKTGGTLELKNGTLTGNTADGSGVGVYIDTGGTFTMSGGEISGNTNSSNASYSGGIVSVSGTFTMNGGKISKNTVTGEYCYGGGVYVSGGTFTMNSGDISGNTTVGGGGGVFVWYGTFIMNGGNITDNTCTSDNYNSARGGGGVFVYEEGTFTMYGGTISSNTARNGGGVSLTNGGTFIMHGGTISGNTAINSGGGVSADWNTVTFIMHGGTISGNTAAAGGGVSVYATFRIVSGTIYGNTEIDAKLRNTASYEGAALIVYSSDSTWTNIAERGTFSGEDWNKAENGDLVTTNNTIKVVNGILQP